MSLFDWLLVAHLVADFSLQTDSMARYKGQDWLWMIRHVGVYMAIMSALLMVYAIVYALPAWPVVAALLFLLVTHTILDRRTFTNWWMRLVGISDDKGWISVVIDQVFHIVTLAIVAQGLVLTAG